MKHAMAMTKNVRKFRQAVDDLLNRPMGTEGMGLLWGEPGEGKSTTVAYVANSYDAVYVRAVGAWTVTSMLGEICNELGLHRMLRRSDMINAISQALADKPRPIFVDEGDYLFRQFEMMDALRDIYDLSGCPVIIIGMEDIARKIQAQGRFARRITQWIEFHGIDLDDTRILAESVCDCDLAEDLLKHLHHEARGNIGRCVIGLSRIEKFANTNGLGTVTLAAWGDRALFYDQPVFGKHRNGR
jgi:DNA transposition AAA+ family ATPase